MKYLADIYLTPTLFINHISAPNAVHINLDRGDMPLLTKTSNIPSRLHSIRTSSEEFDSINKDCSPEEIRAQWESLHLIHLDSLSIC